MDKLPLPADRTLYVLLYNQEGNTGNISFEADSIGPDCEAENIIISWIFQLKKLQNGYIL